MALSDPRLLFGIHSATFYNRTTRLPYGILKVLQNSSLSLSGDQVSLTGGSFRFPWGIEDGFLTTEINLAFNEYPDFVYEIFLGKAVTSVSAEAAGNASTLTNRQGTSVVDASTGIATVGVKSGSEADLKFTKFVVKAVSATTVDVYAYSDVDFARGTDDEYEDDALKITASPLTVTTSSAVEVPNFGVELTGGSGTIAFTTNDTASFEVRPIHTGGATTLTVGATTDVFPEVGVILNTQQAGSGKMFELDVFRAKALGLPHGFNAKEFSEASLTMQAYYDSARSGVFSMREVIP